MTFTIFSNLYAVEYEIQSPTSSLFVHIKLDSSGIQVVNVNLLLPLEAL